MSLEWRFDGQGRELPKVVDELNDNCAQLIILVAQYRDLPTQLSNFGGTKAFCYWAARVNTPPKPPAMRLDAKRLTCKSVDLIDVEQAHAVGSFCRVKQGAFNGSDSSYALPKPAGHHPPREKTFDFLAPIAPSPRRVDWRQMPMVEFSHVVGSSVGTFRCHDDSGTRNTDSPAVADVDAISADDGVSAPPATVQDGVLPPFHFGAPRA